MSWDHAAEARAALTAIVSDPDHGVAALSSAQTMSNLLKDLLPDAPREKTILVAAAEAGLADALRQHVAQGMDPDTAIRLTASSLSQSTPLPPEACNWVASEIAGVMGISQPAAPSGPAAAPGGIPGSGPGGTSDAGPGRPQQGYDVGGMTTLDRGPDQGQLPGTWAPPGGGYPQAAGYQQGAGYPMPSFGSAQFQGYQYPSAPYPLAKKNPLAITALVCGCAQFLLWFLFLIPGFLSAIAAVVTGIVALRQVRARGEGGAGMAIAGIVLGGLGVLGGLFWILIIAVGKTTPPANG